MADQKLLLHRQFGINLQRLRYQHELSQDDVVDEMNRLGSPISRSTYSLIELGKGNLFITDLVALQLIFKVNFEEFFKNIPPYR